MGGCAAKPHIEMKQIKKASTSLAYEHPVEIARRLKHDEIVELLLEHGAEK